MSASAASRLEQNPNVEYVDSNRVVRLTDVQYPTPSWGLNRIDQRSKSYYGDSSYTYVRTGAGVEVYIIDTGIRASMVDFGGRVTIGPDYSADLTCCHFHATHVAGTVAGTVYGVAKLAHLTSVRVLNSEGWAYWDQVIAGIDWIAANHHTPAVANMSIGGDYIQAVNDATAGLVASGVTTVVAAGNAGDDACLYSPSATPAAITVGATAEFDERSDFSNWGACVDLFAPGWYINSDYPFIIGTSTPCDTCHAHASGTSMAAPHVAGVAALYLEANPSATPSDVLSVILANATRDSIQFPSGIGSATSPNLLLYSLLDVVAPPPPPSTTVTANATATCVLLTCTFDASTSRASAGIAYYQWYFGDGSSAGGATLVSPVHTYSKSSRMTVTLTVTDYLAATATTTISVKPTKR
jgi:serine protease